MSNPEGKGGFRDNPENINKSGRPVGSGLNLTSSLKKKLEEVPEGQKSNYSELFIETLLHKALVEHDFQSLRLIINYVDGMPVQPIKGEFSGIRTLEVTITVLR